VDSRSRRISGLRSLTFFHTEYGMPSGPGADEGEDLDSVWANPIPTSSCSFFFISAICLR